MAVTSDNKEDLPVPSDPVIELAPKPVEEPPKAGGTGRPAGQVDDRGRYKIPDPNTGKPARWTRATTFAKAISDTEALQRWAERYVAKGLAERADLLARVERTPHDQRRVLDAITREAKTAAGAWKKAGYGTTFHAMTEKVDLGELDPFKAGPPWGAMLRAYVQVLDQYGVRILPEYVEQTVVVMKYKVAGTFDRVVRMPNGELWVADLKGLALDTPLSTPTGWTTMGKVQVGDQVLGVDGRPTLVTAKSEVKRIGTYVVRFDDGSEIVCDSEHLWQTTTGDPGRAKTTVKSIEDIYGSVHDRHGQAQHRVPVAAPLQLPERELPMDPYLLGVWLGDGANRGGAITGADPELFEFLEQDGHQLGVEQTDARRPHVLTRTVLGLTKTLRLEGLLHNKHIPEAYLRASYDQRLRLLQGLMDTDGTWNTARRTAVFYSCSQDLAENVKELLLTLGQRPRLAFYRAKGFGLIVDAWRVEVDFTPNGINPFRMPRKAGQAAASTKKLSHARRRVIVEVRPGPDVETACIAVDAPDHLYLAGRTMIPTHNTGRDLGYSWGEIAIQLALYANADSIYDFDRGEHVEMPKVNKSQALVIHAPVEGDTVSLHRVNIELGWEAAELCHAVRNWRAFRGLAEEVGKVQVGDDAPDLPRKWVSRIEAATTVADLSLIWQEATAAGEWTEALETLGHERSAELR